MGKAQRWITLKKFFDNCSVVEYHSNMTETQKAYLAGLIDGEGSIGIYNPKTPSKSIIGERNLFYPVIKIGMTDGFETIYELRQCYGGTLYTRKYNGLKNRDCLMLTIRSSGILKLVDDLLPYLRIKKRQALILKEYIQGGEGKYQVITNGQKIVKNKHTAYTRLSEKELLRREKLYKQIKLLNKKGKRTLAETE